MIREVLIWLAQWLFVALMAGFVGTKLIDYYYYRKREYVKQCFDEAEASSQERLFGD